MPAKGIVTLSELATLSIVWAACQNSWKIIVVQGLTRAAKEAFPGLHKYYQSLAVAAVLTAALFALVLLTRNVDIGRYKVFEIDDGGIL